MATSDGERRDRTGAPEGRIERARRDRAIRREQRVEAVTSAIEGARREVQAPWAAGLAGILFAVLFTVALALLRTQPLLTADDPSIARIFASNAENLAVLGGLYLAPFAGIMFLWFIAVIRDQIGIREDQFFATVFLGSGLIFVALLFAATAVADSLFVGPRYLGQRPPTASDVALIRSLAYTLLFVFGTRAAAVFLASTATISLRNGIFPRGLSLAGIVLAIALMFGVAFWDWVILVMPAWVAVMSAFVIGREHGRMAGRRTAKAP